MTRSDKLVKNTLILGIGTILSKGMTFLMVPFFSKWLTASEYGSFDLFITYVTLAVPVLSLSVGEAVFRFLIDDTDKKSIVTNSTIILGIAIAISVLFGFFLNNRIQKGILFSLELLLISQLVNEYLLCYVRGRKRLECYTLANLLTMFAIVFFTTWYVYVNQMGLEGMLLGYASAYTISNIFLLFKQKVYRNISLKYASLIEIKRLLMYSFPLIPNSISWWIVNVSDRTIVSYTLGMATNGVYAIANKIPSLCTTIFSVFHLSWQESVAEAINEPDRNVFFDQVLNRIIRIYVTICIGVLGCNYFFFSWIFEERYIKGYNQVPILIFAVVFSAISQFFGGIFIAIKDTKRNGSTTVCAAVVNLVINIIFIRYIGLYAASISTLISQLFLCVIRYRYIKELYKINIYHSNIILLCIFVYFGIIQYLQKNSFIALVNLGLAIVTFFLFNMDIIELIIKRVLKRGNV